MQPNSQSMGQLLPSANNMYILDSMVHWYMVHYSLSVTGIIYFKILKEGIHVYTAGNSYTLVVTKNQ